MNTIETTMSTVARTGISASILALAACAGQQTRLA
jgi:hypothetical protein